MIPIHELLNRIRWDAEYAKGDFQIGYFDRMQQKIIKVPLKQIAFIREDHFAFQFYDEEGEAHSVPLHRIKEVYRGGELIWHREH